MKTDIDVQGQAMTRFKKQRAKLLQAALILGAASTAQAEPVSKVPILGGLYHSTQIIKEQILDGSSNLIATSRDLTLFTVGGLTLDAYILTLPLDADTKGRVIARLANPAYAIQLGYFLAMFKGLYGGYDDQDQFKAHLLTVYEPQALSSFEHSLMRFTSKPAEPSKEPESPSLVNDELIATLVSLYDVLFNNERWVLGRNLDDHYQYLDNSDADQALIAKVQPLLIPLLAKVHQGMEPGEFKQMLGMILEDAKPENANKVNNKAQAVTISLIDFVRFSVLKSYRQFALAKHRSDAFENWMTNTLDEDPKALLDFLRSQDKRPRAVQVVVDGLQQGLVEALVDADNAPNRFLTTAWQQHQNRQQFEPGNEASGAPEHQQQLGFLTKLAEAPYQDPNYLPFFKALYQQPQGIVAQGSASTPTISVRNLPITKTGAKVAGPGGTGIPNFHFVDRQQDRAYYFFGNDALQLERIFNQSGGRSMFDRLPYLKTMSCNAQYDWNAQLGFDALLNLGLGEAIRDFGERRCLGELNRRAKAEVEIRQQRQQLIAALSDYMELSWLTPLSKISGKRHLIERIINLAQLAESGMPDYLLIYNPWPDHFAHFTGPFSDEIIAPTGELNRLDFWLGKTESVYKDAGIYEQTLWGMAGDHGLAPVYYTLNPEVQVLEALQQDYGIKLEVKKISSDEGEGPKITNALNFPSNRGVDVVIASTAGGNYMLDLFNSHQSWQTQPLYGELIHWQPQHSVREIDLISEAATRLKHSLDYLVVRQSPCDLRQCSVRLVGHRDGQRFDELIQRQGKKVLYRSLAEQSKPTLLNLLADNPYKAPLTKLQRQQQQRLADACLIQASPSNPESWCNESQWRQLASFGARPDAVNQLAHLYDEDRSGTINLFPKEGVGYNTKVPGRHAGEHYLEKDAFVGFWGAPVTAKQRIELGENGSLAPTIYEYLSGETITKDQDGWGYPSLLPELRVTAAN
ncbi:alkaline phosphatase family protein [Ferrimonas aestuarii]|nr:alkaline phosphatase family protein [Ferrimonas aestuarii]